MRLFNIFTVLSILSISQISFANSTINPNSSVVHLRISCEIGGGQFEENCFESTSALTDWLWDSGRTNLPSEDDRVHVIMGPGEFAPFECIGSVSSPTEKGWVSVTGSGATSSKFTRADKVVSINSSCAAAIEIKHCDGSEFSNIGAYGPTGVNWAGAGTGKWNHVDMIGEITEENACPSNYSGSLGWYDIADGASDKSLQYIFSSRIWALDGGGSTYAQVGFNSHNSESWIYGSDIAGISGVAETLGFNMGVFILAPADVRVFGGTIRAVSSAAHEGNYFEGVRVKGGTFHMHGGIISLDSTKSSVITTTAIYVEASQSVVHTPGTAFVVKAAASSTSSRLKDTGSNSKIMSPFLWQASEIAPTRGSLHGQDMFVDTNADGTGEAHLMVFDNTCSSKWRDMVTGDCR